MRVGSDTGGTFTDIVDATGAISKVLSTPAAPDQAVAAGLAGLAGVEVSTLAHGTTVATNALLEGTGATVALVTNEGFGDVIEIGRQDRPSLYDHWADRPPVLVAAEHRYGVPGRLDAQGAELERTAPEALVEIDPVVEAVAVSLLHSDVNSQPERDVAQALGDRGWDVTASHEVSPEFREYERTLTTVINAYLRPSCRAYLKALARLAPEVLALTSAGGLIPVARAADIPASLLLSGPAGGVRAAAAVAVANGCPDAISFDMGGTSTDVCLIRGGRPEPASERSVGGYAIRLPALDVVTIGAGGGSIAAVDPGGALSVGPASAGAHPGPACYGQGGVAPTVTDANLAAGRIDEETSLPDLGRLRTRDAEAALAGLGMGSPAQAARGVLTVVNATMERALRAVSVERGVNPRSLALVAFGGAGALHACDLADGLGMDRVLVPARAGVFSAVGVLAAPHQREVVRSRADPQDLGGIDNEVAELAESARVLVRRADKDPEVAVAVDCRYRGQSHELSVRAVPAFHEEHERRNGYSRPDAPVEVVAIRAQARVASGIDVAGLAADPRQPVTGPAVISEPDCTVWVPEGWQGEPVEAGALMLRRTR